MPRALLVAALAASSCACGGASTDTSPLDTGGGDARVEAYDTLPPLPDDTGASDYGFSFDVPPQATCPVGDYYVEVVTPTRTQVFRDGCCPGCDVPNVPSWTGTLYHGGEDAPWYPGAVACDGAVRAAVIDDPSGNGDWKIFVRNGSTFALDVDAHVDVTYDDRVLGGVVAGTFEAPSPLSDASPPTIHGSFRVCRVIEYFGK